MPRSQLISTLIHVTDPALPPIIPQWPSDPPHG